MLVFNFCQPQTTLFVRIRVSCDKLGGFSFVGRIWNRLAPVGELAEFGAF